MVTCLHVGSFVCLWGLLICLAGEALVVRSSSLIDGFSFPYFHFQHELSQAYYFDEHVASAAVNLTDYINDWEICTKSPEPWNPAWKPTHQHGWLAEYWGGRSFLWVAQSYGYGNHKKPDCSYTIHGPTINYYPSSNPDPTHLAFYSFNFQLDQSSCTSEKGSKIIGGSTFELLGYSDKALGSCLYEDYYNNSYAVSCRFAVSPAEARTVPRVCMRLTVLLDMEHFDAYSEVLRTGNWDYPTGRVPIVDDEQYCGELPLGLGSPSAKLTAANEYSITNSVYSVDIQSPEGTQAVLTSSQFNLLSSYTTGIDELVSKSVSIFTGLWAAKTPGEASTTPLVSNRLDAEVMREYGFTCDNVTLFDLLLGHDSELPKPLLGRASRSAHQPLTMPPAELLLSAGLNRHEAPSLKENYEPCHLMAVDYKNSSGRIIHFEMLREKEAPIVPKVATTISELSVKYSFRPLLQLWSSDRARLDMYVPSFPRLSQLLTHDGRKYLFLGASHMRYFYMFTMESIFGRKIVNGVDRKGSYFEMGNGKYVYQDSGYANYETDRLKEICNRTVDPGVEYTVVMQTGSWDMFTGSLRKLIRSPRSAQELLKTISDILQGRLPCAHLTHLIWVTSVPFPVCYEIGCDKMRGYRTSTAMAAEVEFYMSSLLKLRMLPSKRLSIVDAFSIIQPRAGLSYNYESVCDDHYQCIVQGYRGLFEMTYTPGGLGVSQAILHALTEQSS
jgi:hypothetical protein